MENTTQAERAQRSLWSRVTRPSSITEGPPWLWPLGLAALVVGLVAWGFVAITGSIFMGVTATWCFTLAGVVMALALPLPYALVAPLYAGVVGWLVDMLPLVVLVTWLAVIARWGLGLLRERRLPRGGRWIWLPIGLLFWTSLGILVVGSLDLKHFALLFGIQTLSTGTLLAVVDQLAELEQRVRAACGLVAFIVVMSVGVFLQWIGVPIQPLQDSATKVRVEAAWGLDAFPNITGMIKYARSRNAGNEELRRRLSQLKGEVPELPDYDTFTPKFKSFRNQLVVRFEGSARPFEQQLAEERVTLLYDNLGVAPGNTVPRMRSFPRNALTYAGACAAVLPMAFFLAWTQPGRRRWLGWAGVASCLFGAGFSLARGSWMAIAIGVVYVLLEGVFPRVVRMWRSRRRTDAPVAAEEPASTSANMQPEPFLSKSHRIQMVGAVLIGALVLTGVFVIKYGSDPMTARSGGEGSVATRAQLYEDTVDTVKGIHYLVGFGTEQPRRDAATGSRSTFGKYVPAAGTHSTYLNYLFRTGVPGALGIIVIYLVAGLHARTAALTKSGAERIFAGMAAMSIVIIGAHAVILNLFVEPVYTLTVSLMVGFAMAGTTNMPRSVLPWKHPVG